MIDVLLLVMPGMTGALTTYIAYILRHQRTGNHVLTGLFWCLVLITLAFGWLVLTELAFTFIPTLAFIEQRTIRAGIFRALMLAAMARLWWEFR